MIPELHGTRRFVARLIEQLWPSVYAVVEASEAEYAGVVEGVDPDDFEMLLRADPDIYPCNVASVKYVEPPSGSTTSVDSEGGRIYDIGSWAIREGGFFGKWQTHIRLFPHRRGTALFVHHELNPWVRPQSHYMGKKWDAAEGKAIVRDRFDVNESVPLSGIFTASR